MTEHKSIVREIESALSLGQFVHWRERQGFFAELKLAKTPIDNQRSKGQFKDAVRLYEVFLAGSFEKANEVDDSGGDVAFWIRGLMSDIVETLQESQEAPEKIASKIVGWIDKDDYGFTDHFDSELLHVGKPEIIAAMRKLLETRSLVQLDKVTGQDRFELRKIIGETAVKDFDWLQAIYLHQHDIPSYLKIVETFGLEPENCEKIATLLEKQEDLTGALVWAEKGLTLMSGGDPRFRYSSGGNLPQLHRRILKGLGRQKEAFQAAWAEFEQHPSVYTYREVAEFVDPAESSQWYERARDLVLKQDSDHLSCTFEFLTEYGEFDLLRDLIGNTRAEVLEKISYVTLKETAKTIKQRAPLAAAKLYKAEAIEILSKAESKAYHYALENLAKVKAIYEANGHAREWATLAGELQVQHKRKSSFIGEFNSLVSGKVLSKKPTFMERIGKHLDKSFSDGDLE